MQLAEPARSFLERPYRLLAAATVLYWSTTLAVALRADDLSLGAIELLNVVILGPLALACAFRIAAHVGGVALGAWTLLVWLAAPWIAPVLTLAKYDATVRDDVLPLVVGLTSDRGYLEAVAILGAVALLTLGVRLATAAAALLFAALLVTWLSRFPAGDLSVDAFKANMAGLREYFWSHRFLQWLPVAGVIAVARRSIPFALLLGGWLGGYVAFRASRTDVGFDDGEFFRVLLPGLPGYFLLAAAVPLLVPTLAARLGPLARPS